MEEVDRTITVYISDSGQEYSSPAECLNYELHDIQAKRRSILDCEPVRDFTTLAILISLEPTVLDKLEELALLCGMEPRDKSEKGTNQ